MKGDFEMATDELKELGKDLSNEELGKVAGGQAASLGARSDLAAPAGRSDIPLSGGLAAPADDQLGIHVIPKQDSSALNLPPKSRQ